MIKSLVLSLIISITSMIPNYDIYHHKLNKSRFIFEGLECEVSEDYKEYTDMIDIYTDPEIEDSSITIFYNEDSLIVIDNR